MRREVGYAPRMGSGDLGERRTEQIRWLSTGDAAERLGIALRTLYKLIDEGELPAYKFGRVLRLQQHEVDAFIGRSRVEPGSLKHLYPEAKGAEGADDLSDGVVIADLTDG